MEILNPEPTNDKTRIKITYDENPAFEGKELTNADRYQFSKGENNWETATTNPMIVEAETNGIIYARYYDGKEGYKIKPVTVNNIDKLAPYDFDLQVTATENSITVSAAGEVRDNWPTDGIFAPTNGGIRGYQFQLLSEDGTTVLKDWTPAYPYHENSCYTFSKAQDEVEIKAGTTYKVNMRAIDKAGNSTPARNIGSEEASVTTESVGTPIAQVVKVGDYVNYDAGKWTQEDFDKIRSSTRKPTVNESSALPTTQGEFGGFTIGQSRNTNSTSLTYKPESEGWRIWDIADDGTVTIISAGNPETYYHEYVSNSNNGNISARILKDRNCTMYENSYAQSGSAKMLTGEEAARWYNKNFGTSYTLIENDKDSSTFYWRGIGNTNLAKVLCNGSSFWLATALTPQLVWSVCPINNSFCYWSGEDVAWRNTRASYAEG